MASPSWAQQAATPTIASPDSTRTKDNTNRTAPVLEGATHATIFPESAAPAMQGATNGTIGPPSAPVLHGATNGTIGPPFAPILPGATNGTIGPQGGSAVACDVSSGPDNSNQLPPVTVILFSLLALSILTLSLRYIHRKKKSPIWMVGFAVAFASIIVGFFWSSKTTMYRDSSRCGVVSTTATTVDRTILLSPPTELIKPSESDYVRESLSRPAFEVQDPETLHNKGKRNSGWPGVSRPAEHDR